MGCKKVEWRAVDKYVLNKNVAGAIILFLLFALSLTVVSGAVSWPFGFMGVYGIPDEIERHVLASTWQIAACLSVLLAPFISNMIRVRPSLVKLFIILIIALHVWVFLGEKYIPYGIVVLIVNMIILIFSFGRRGVFALLFIFILIQNVFAFAFDPTEPNVVQCMSFVPAVAIMWTGCKK